MQEQDAAEAPLQGSSPVKDRVREYLRSNPGKHDPIDVARALGIKVVDTLEAGMALARDEGIGYNITIVGAEPAPAPKPADRQAFAAMAGKAKEVKEVEVPGLGIVIFRPISIQDTQIIARCRDDKDRVITTLWLMLRKDCPGLTRADIESLDGLTFCQLTDAMSRELKLKL